MTTAQLARRVATLELAQRDDDVPMSIGVDLVDGAGVIVQRIPAQPIPDLRQPGRRVDYRAAIALEVQP